VAESPRARRAELLPFSPSIPPFRRSQERVKIKRGTPSLPLNNLLAR
jgi:hypothetical protein